MITEETIARVKTFLQREKAFLTLEVIEDLENQIEKMKNCQNCKNRYPETKADYIFCAECPKLDETKDNIILTKWELAE